MCFLWWFTKICKVSEIIVTGWWISSLEVWPTKKKCSKCYICNNIVIWTLNSSQIVHTNIWLIQSVLDKMKTLILLIFCMGIFFFYLHLQINKCHVNIKYDEIDMQRSSRYPGSTILTSRIFKYVFKLNKKQSFRRSYSLK